jgi:hypothetical protein
LFEIPFRVTLLLEMHTPGSNPTAPFKDRSKRLILFGLVSILVGCFSVLLGLLHLLLLAAGGVPGAESIALDARTSAMGVVLYGLLGGAFIWVGAGSIRKRRWARPLMLTLSWTWLLGGAIILLLLPGMLDLVLLSGPGMQAMDPASVSLVKLLGLGLAAVFGVVLPAVFVWTYNDRNLRLTCEAEHPSADWTERCPPSALGLSVGLGASGALALPMALRPAVPLFGMLLSGWPGALLLIAGGLACLWLAREVYALTMRGWWATTIFLLLIGLSTWLTLHYADPGELFHAMGYPDDFAIPGDSFISVNSWLTITVTMLTLVYMGAIRKHFGVARAPQ